MRFRSTDENREESQGGYQSPPNYTSRRVQYRLLVMVALAMTLLLGIEWIWNLSRPDAQQAVSSRPVVAASDKPISFGRSNVKPGDVEADTRDRAESDLWNSLLDQMDEDEQQLMLRVLRMIRSQDRIPNQDKEDWWQLYQKLDAGWIRFHDASFLAITQNTNALNELQRATWLNALDDLDSVWRTELRQAMLAITEDKQLELADQQALEIMQRALDRAALSRVEDHTVFRNREHAAWYRIMELLQRSAPAELASQTHGSVGGVQLMNQPDFYRGKLISLRGTIRGAYRTSAPQNPIGVEEYTVLFIEPPDTAEPVVAFCLETPAGFPPVAFRGAEVLPGQPPPQQLSFLREDAELTGFFFKSWVYLTENSTISAPLLLVRSPTWQPPVVTAPEPPQATSTTLMTIVGIASFCAVAVVLLVDQRSRKMAGRDRTELDPVAVGQTLHSIPPDEVHPSTRESLKTLSSQPLESDAGTDGSSDEGITE